MVVDGAGFAAAAGRHGTAAIDFACLGVCPLLGPGTLAVQPWGFDRLEVPAAGQGSSAGDPCRWVDAVHLEHVSRQTFNVQPSLPVRHHRLAVEVTAVEVTAVW